jgi:hypothetical protein
MSLNAAFVRIKVAALGFAPAGQDEAPLRFVRYSRHNASIVMAPRSSTRLCGIGPLEDFRQCQLGLLAPLFNGQDAITAHRQPAAPAIGVAILHNERLSAAGLDAQSEAGDFIVP